MSNQASTVWVRTVKEEDRHIAIESKDGRRLGALSPITRLGTGIDDAEIALLCDWHNRTLNAQLNRKPWEVASTRNWLASTDEDDSQLHCWIHDVTGRRIGHCGVIHLREAAALVYDVARGIPGGHPLLMPYADVTLARLALFGAGCDQIEGGIFADNPLALRSALMAGFTETGAKWLTPSDDGLRMVEATTRHDGDALQHWLVLDRESFVAKYPLLASFPPLSITA